MPMPVAIPAFRKAMSSRPCRSVTARTAAALSSYDDTSHATNVPPVSAATFSPLSRSTSDTTTRGPSDASPLATPAPNPFAPPVIHATFPSNRFSTTEAPVSAEDLLAHRPCPRTAQVDELLRPLRTEMLVRRNRGYVGRCLDPLALLGSGGGQLSVVREQTTVAQRILRRLPLLVGVAAGRLGEVLGHSLARSAVGDGGLEAGQPLQHECGDVAVAPVLTQQCCCVPQLKVCRLRPWQGSVRGVERPSDDVERGCRLAREIRRPAHLVAVDGVGKHPAQRRVRAVESCVEDCLGCRDLPDRRDRVAHLRRGEVVERRDDDLRRHLAESRGPAGEVAAHPALDAECGVALAALRHEVDEGVQRFEIAVRGARLLSSVESLGRHAGTLRRRLRHRAAGAAWTDADDLERVALDGAPGPPRHRGEPTFEPRRLDLDRRAASLAVEMVMVRPRVTATERGLATRSPQDVDGAVIGEGLQGSVDAREPDAAALAA